MPLNQRLYLILAAIIAKIFFYTSKLSNLGTGSSGPGKIVMALFPGILKILVPRFKFGWILITGTNGKTTTTKILVEIMKEYNLTVVTNVRGANLLSGIVTSILLAKLKLNEEFMADYAIFEIDEAVLAKSFHILKPYILVITNFSRDQLDRYGEVDSHVNKIIERLRNADFQCKVILNGNDPNIVRIGATVPSQNRLYFGIKDELPSSETGLLFENETGKNCISDFPLPQLDLWAEKIRTNYLKGSHFLLKYHHVATEIYLELPGIFNILNALAAIIVCMAEVDHDLVRVPVILANMRPSFGRSEHFEYQGNSIYLFLVKNPVGFNHIIQLLNQSQSNKRVLIILNDLTVDGKDVSWIWDIAFENLWKIAGIQEVITSGTRAGDMGLRVKYSNQPSTIALTVDYKPNRATQRLLQRLTHEEELFILANYTSMLRIRPYLQKISKR
jgi:lipid II isoglutaminyl synthase (glutamine-hydrolysing)